MTDPWPADEIAAAFRDAAPEFATSLHADRFELVRGTNRVPDGYGGWTEEPNVVASGRCALMSASRQGREGASGAVIVSRASYRAELPLEVDVLATDTLRVNGRTFEIVANITEGEMAMFTELLLEERS